VCCIYYYSGNWDSEVCFLYRHIQHSQYTPSCGMNHNRMFTYVQAIRTEVFRAYSQPLQTISGKELSVTGAGIAQSVQCLATDWTTGLSRFYLQQTQRIFPLISVSRPALGPTQPPVQWVPWVLSLGTKRGRVVALTTHPRLVPRSWMCTSYTTSPPLVATGVLSSSFPFFFKLWHNRFFPYSI
jgi:hypothetical protein